MIYKRTGERNDVTQAIKMLRTLFPNGQMALVQAVSTGCLKKRNL